MSRLTPLAHLRREAPGGRADQRRRASDGRRHVLCSEYFPWITLSRNGVQSPDGLARPSRTGNISEWCGDSEGYEPQGSDALRRRRGAGDRW
jgi:hypothetical protein